MYLNKIAVCSLCNGRGFQEYLGTLPRGERGGSKDKGAQVIILVREEW